MYSRSEAEFDRSESLVCILVVALNNSLSEAILLECSDEQAQGFRHTSLGRQRCLANNGNS